ncbi:MAG: GNAT family N-acetyltransferase [Candidatus Kariarchaeaceae archaeon]|jgi:ribosomal protein S18 acetylase RimI-like enzyme
MVDKVEILKTLTELKNKHQDVEIEIIETLGQCPILRRRELAQLLKGITEKDPTHLITASYARDNLWSRPLNIFVIVNSDQLILNISDQQIMCIEPGMNEDATIFARDFVLSLTEAFVFTSGSRIGELLEERGTDDTCRNIVYRMDSFKPILTDYPILRIDDAENELELESIEAAAEDLWNYESISRMRNPHVAIFQDGVPVAGGRANAVLNDAAVIGGVRVLKSHRRKGYGGGVSSSLTQILLDMGLEVYLETDEDNIPAQKIYERLGFLRVGESRFHDIGTSVIRDHIIGDRDY